jgi:hypothetical protein
VNEGVNIPPRGLILPLGARGEVKNGPLGFAAQLDTTLLGIVFQKSHSESSNSKKVCNSLTTHHDTNAKTEFKILPS